ncbi:MAG: [FeFe] hydrogenase H-cluster radical SAM maturase HydG [Bacteroidales bacterium]|nr:[FeFe] hydrogenase H-cluster radical SAM maturase HydG [Bacteroidales bacterium]
MAYKMDRALSKGAFDFIDAEKLSGLLSNQTEDKVRLREIFAKSMEKNPLTLEETAALLAIRSKEGLEELFATAKALKKAIYGNRIVLFAPLYIGNLCINDCLYCGFRKSSGGTVRKTLTQEEIIAEVKALQDEGQKRLILVFGESPVYSPDFIAGCVKTVYGVHSGNGSIRRVNINAAPLDVEGYRRIKEEGIGTYQIFQETYHRETYGKYHPANTVKGDYMWRLDGLDRAFEAGIDDLGIGALIGLYDWRFEVLGLVSHALHLKEKFGVGPHTISFPRIQPAEGMNLPLPYKCSDEDFKHLVAVLRLAVPYTGMIMTARESPEIRNEVMHLGVSQIDAGTHLEIGGYSSHSDKQALEREQFQVGDTRGLDQVTGWLLGEGFIPSFCTSCYRAGRTGDRFMEFAEKGLINKFCTPNALLTLAEFLQDYASPATKELGNALIEKELQKMPEDAWKERIKDNLKKISLGERDLRV